MGEIFLSPGHAAARLGISGTRLQQLARENRIQPLLDSGGRRIYLATQVESLRRAREARGLPRRIGGRGHVRLRDGSAPHEGRPDGA